MNKGEETRLRNLTAKSKGTQKLSSLETHFLKSLSLKQKNLPKNSKSSSATVCVSRPPKPSTVLDREKLSNEKCLTGSEFRIFSAEISAEVFRGQPRHPLQFALDRKIFEENRTTRLLKLAARTPDSAGARSSEVKWIDRLERIVETRVRLEQEIEEARAEQTELKKIIIGSVDR